MWFQWLWKHKIKVFLCIVMAIFWCKHANEYIFDVSGPEGSSARDSKIAGIFLKVRVHMVLVVPSGFFFFLW